MERRIFLKALALAAVLAPGLPALAETRTVIDSAGRSVAVPEAPQRVLAAGPPASVLLYVLAPDKMAGWVHAPSAAEKTFIAAPYRDLPVTGRLTGKGDIASPETVLATKPDLILDVGSVDPAYASLADRVQEQTGIPYVLIDGSFARTPETLREVGVLLGVPETAGKQAAFAEGVLTRLAARVAAVPQSERPRVYYGRGPDGLETGLAGSINTEILAAVGGVNVAEAAGPGGLARVSAEQVIAWNPDVILAADPAFQAKLANDPAWANVTAVREGRVYRAPARPFGWLDAPPGVNRIIGVDWLTRVLYPAADGPDLRAAARAFYSLFYHVELTGAALDTLLPGAVPMP